MPIIDARYYKALLISPNRALSSEITPMLASGLPLAPIQDIPAYPTRRQIVDLLRTVEPKLCFLDFSQQSAFEVLSEIHSLNPSLPVVALLGANSPDLVLQCMRQGAMDFLIRPFTSDQIDACVEKIARLIPAPFGNTAGGKVIAVMPAKGGSGATTIACNLAHQCKRLGAERVLLADLDPLTGTVSFVLKLKSTYSFIDVLHREDSLEADLWKQMTTVSQGVEVLLGPESLVDPNTELSSGAPIVDFAQSIYEAVVLDCGGVYGGWNMSLARLSDEVLLVATNEIASLYAAQRALMYMDSQRVDMNKVKLVVNRYHKDNGLLSDNIKDAFPTEVFQTIPADSEAVQKSLMDGKPIQGNTVIGKNLSTLADKLVSFEKNSKKGKDKGSGLLSSFFR